MLLRLARDPTVSLLAGAAACVLKTAPASARVRRCRHRIEDIVAQHPPKVFVDEGTRGFGFDEDNRLIWPPAYDGIAQAASIAREHVARVEPSSFEPYPYDKAPLNPLANYVSLLGQDKPQDAVYHPEAFTGSLRASAKVSMYLDPHMLPEHWPERFEQAQKGEHQPPVYADTSST